MQTFQKILRKIKRLKSGREKGIVYTVSDTKPVPMHFYEDRIRKNPILLSFIGQQQTTEGIYSDSWQQTKSSLQIRNKRRKNHV